MRAGQIIKTLFFLADGRRRGARRRRPPGRHLKAPSRDRGGTQEAEDGQPGGGAGTHRLSGRRRLTRRLGNGCDVVVDHSLRRFTDVWAAAGAGNAVFPANTDALVDAIHGQWADIVRDAG